MLPPPNPHLCIVCFITFMTIYKGKFCFCQFCKKGGFQFINANLQSHMIYILRFCYSRHGVPILKFKILIPHDSFMLFALCFCPLAFSDFFLFQYVPFLCGAFILALLYLFSVCWNNRRYLEKFTVKVISGRGGQSTLLGEKKACVCWEFRIRLFLLISSFYNLSMYII